MKEDAADGSSLIVLASAVKDGNNLVIISEKVIFLMVGLLFEPTAIASAIFSLPPGWRRNFCVLLSDVLGVPGVMGGVGRIPLNSGVGEKRLPLILLLLLLASSSSLLLLLLLSPIRFRLKSVNLSNLSCKRISFGFVALSVLRFPFPSFYYRQFVHITNQ